MSLVNNQAQKNCIHIRLLFIFEQLKKHALNAYA